MMRTLRKGICLVMTLVIALTSMVWFSKGEQTEAGNLVVVLDAGHDSAHGGAAGNNLYEEVLNLQIALACKNELETYEGVTVHMVRETESCPYGGASIGGAVTCNQKRVDFAKNVGADVYVSLHNNSSDNKSARGVSVYYPTTNYNYHCGVTGAGLARAVRDQLLTIGLQDRGIYVRYSEDGSRYPDGSLADYYGVIKNSKLKGIPAIIIEHAFISNAQDAKEFLSTYEKMWALGVLDAKGIAQYYGLEKKIVLDYSNASTSAYMINNAMEAYLQASGITGAQSVSFGVWSSVDGQSDLQVYDAVLNGNGNWIATVPITNHASEGVYLVDTYVNQNIYIGQTRFQVQGPYIGNVEVVQANPQQGSFVLEIAGAFSGTDVDSVSAAIWNEAHPNDVKWIQAKPMGNGLYQLTVSISQFGYEYGTYQMQTYIRDNNAIVKCVDTQSFTLECPDIAIEVTRGAVSAAYRVQANGIPYGDGITRVKFRVSPVATPEAVTSEGVTPEAVTPEAITPEAVTPEAITPEAVTPEAITPETVTTEAITSEALTPEVVAEYNAVQNDQGCWVSSVYPAEIGTPGMYKVEVYGKLSNNKEVLLGETYFSACATPQSIVTDDAVITVNPWCDYGSVGKALENSDRYYRDYVAYELIREPVGQIQMTFDIPEYMQEKEIEVFQVVTGESLQLVPVEATCSVEKDKVSIPVADNGLFVIAAKENVLTGDVNFNNQVELADAQLALRAALALEQLDVYTSKCCDVNKDGNIDLTDAQLILKLALRIIEDVNHESE